jgi:hypothetical protein
MTRHDRAAVRALLSAVILGAVSAARGGAQLPGLPVLQNAFATPGFAAAVNGGGGSGTSAFAVAGGWAPGSARFQISVGAGWLRASGGNGGAFGARVSAPVFSMMNGNLGIAAFGGIGGGQGPRQASGQRTGYGNAPLGAAVGYRRALGATRALSFYAAPFVGFFRNDFGDSAKSASLFRVSLGSDFALTRALGLTVGLEAGQSRAGADRPGPSGVVWGAGVSYVFGRR